VKLTLEAASHGLSFALESTLLAQKYLTAGSLVEVAPQTLSALQAWAADPGLKRLLNRAPGTNLHTACCLHYAC
jgi:hypothetical protein